MAGARTEEGRLRHGGDNAWARAAHPRVGEEGNAATREAARQSRLAARPLCSTPDLWTTT